MSRRYTRCFDPGTPLAGFGQLLKQLEMGWLALEVTLYLCRVDGGLGHVLQLSPVFVRRREVVELFRDIVDAADSSSTMLATSRRRRLVVGRRRDLRMPVTPR